MTAISAGAGLLRFGNQPRPSMRLFCFPYAGGGAATYRAWPAALPTGVELIAIQLPGTESRVREVPLDTITAMVAEFAPAIAERSDLPFAFFGHSLGAVLAFEIVRTLRRAGARQPELLMVSGRRPPRVRDRHPPLRHLPDEQLVASISARYDGIRPEVFQHPELVALLLPGLRAGIAAIETHEFQHELPIACPLIAFGGDSDRMAPPADIEAWQLETTGRFASRTFPGDHFYLLHQPAPLLAEVAAALRTHVPHGPARA